jgi:hypothetical protein
LFKGNPNAYLNSPKFRKKASDVYSLDISKYSKMTGKDLDKFAIGSLPLKKQFASQIFNSKHFIIKYRLHRCTALN